MEYKITCPFCGADITGKLSYDRAINQEETVKREFTPGYNWGGNYLKETKYVRHFKAFCCKKCYEEYLKYERITNKMASIAIPIGIIVGIAFTAYMRNIKNSIEFGIDSIFAYIVGILIGIFVCSIPTMIVNLAHRKKISYKKACECNAAG